MPDENTTTGRRESIIQAATGIFLRYGFTRTTMKDVAEAARLSRPTLYQSFPDKESIFREVVFEMGQKVFRTIREGLQREVDLEAKLLLACNAWGSEGFELVVTSPDASDLFDQCFEPVKDIDQEFEALLVELLASPLSKTDLPISAAELARTLVFSIKGFKYTARSGEDLRRLIAVNVKTIAIAIEARTVQS